MSVFSTGMNHRSFLWQITALCFVLGLLMSAAWQTATQIKRAGMTPQRPGFFYGSDFQVAAKKAAEYEKEINKLNGEIAHLIKGKDAESEKNKKLAEYRLFAGLTQVSGPGVQVTLIDSNRHNSFGNDPLNLSNLIHDADIVMVVNELKAAGAEALSVNGERIIGISSIRCVGPVVHVNNVPAAPPYIIQAVGDQNALFGGINLPNGVLDRLRQFDATMVKVEKRDKMLLPAFAGGTQMHFAHEAKPNEESNSKESNSKESNSKESNSKETNSKETRTKDSDTRDSNSKGSSKETGKENSTKAADNREARDNTSNETTTRDESSGTSNGSEGDSQETHKGADNQ